MRIVAVVSFYKPAFVYGGPVRSISALCEGLIKAGAQVTVLTTNANGAEALTVPTGQPVNVDGVQVYYYPRWGSRLIPFYYYSPGLKQACQEKIRKFDVVYICGTWTYAMLAGARGALEAGVPFVVSPRGSFMTKAMSQKPLKKHVYLALIERWLINRAAALHCTSRIEQTQLLKWAFRPPSVIIPNSLDLTPYRQVPERGKIRQSLSISADGTLSLFIGRLHKEKRLDLIIQAFAMVASRLPKAHLLIVGPEGDGSGKKAQSQTLELGLGDRIHFFGMLTGADLLQAYVDADLKILCSIRENFAMVVAEAMAVGLPVLLTPEIGLAKEVVKAGAGYCVSPQKEEIAQTWVKMLENPGLRHEMGQKGQFLVQNEFSSEVVSGQMLKLFERVVTHRL